MPSKLIGRVKKLEWKDFGTPKAGAAPAAGVKASAAETDADFKFTKGPSAVRLPGVEEYKLQDDLEITVSMKSSSWVMKWVFDRDQAFQDAMLNHEQHHYDIAALIARDLFIDLMAIKPKVFGSTAELQKAIDTAKSKYTGKVKVINDLYDTATSHGKLATEQKTWDGYINTAFTKERVPKFVAPDGATYKQGLIETLKAAGITV